MFHVTPFTRYQLRMILLFLLFQTLSSTVAKRRGLSSGDVAARYKHKNAVFDVKVYTESNVISFILSLFKI